MIPKVEPLRLTREEWAVLDALKLWDFIPDDNDGDSSAAFLDLTNSELAAVLSELQDANLVELVHQSGRAIWRLTRAGKLVAK